MSYTVDQAKEEVREIIDKVTADMSQEDYAYFLDELGIEIEIRETSLRESDGYED